ncbi:MAG: hypothetical protein KJ626_12925 [Verrucomicrobia bacterium]|nr:hypothetical protein [Verrucomicrobiota bacterium]
MDKPEVKFGDWIEAGFNLWKPHIGNLVVVSLIALLLSFTIILAAPMMAGLVLIALKIHDDPKSKVEISDLFKGFDYFVQSLLFVLALIVLFVVLMIVQFLPCIGSLIYMAAAIIVQALVAFAMFLIVDRKMDFWPATMASVDLVKQNLWPFVGLTLVASIIGQIGAVACGIGIIVTLPINYLILAVAYRACFSGASPAVVEAEVVEEPKE